MDRTAHSAGFVLIYFQQQVEKLRQVETNPTNYRLSAGGYLTEIGRMHLAVREYLWLHPSEVTA